MNNGGDLLAVQATQSGVYITRVVPSKILDELQISTMGEQLSKLVDDGARKLVIDFSAVDHLTSSALGMLIRLRQNMAAVKGALRLCNIRPEIYQIFKITGLDKMFSIYPTATDALASF